jgi:hypothetical protein
MTTVKKTHYFLSRTNLSRAFVWGSDFSEASSIMKLYETKFCTVSQNEMILNENLQAILFCETK